MVMAGKLDRNILFQKVEESSNVMNEKVPTYTKAFDTFAKVMETEGKEGYEGDQKQDRSDIKLKIRYREDITRESRFVYKGETYDVVGIKELGKRDALLILGNIRAIPA